MRIVVLDGHTLNPGDTPWTPLEALGQVEVHADTGADEIVPRCRGAEVVVTNKVPLSAETLDALDDLRLIAVTATGYNVVDVAAARRRGVDVCNVPAYATDSVAQFTFALLLELCHQVGRHDGAVRAGQWQACGHFSFHVTPLVELAGRTMGLIGFGRIGRRVGELAHAFGMDVLAADVAPPDPPDYRPFAFAPVEQVFAAADVVSLHCPQRADNVGFVNAALLGRMKKNAFLLNTARGGLVVEQDLADALQAGRLAGAAVDVVSVEPIRPDNPLLSAPHCLLTPHIAWATRAARQRLMDATAANVAAWARGRPRNVVN